jgi:transposase
LKNIRKSIEKETSTKEIAIDENLSLKTVYNLIKQINDGKNNEEILFKKKGRKPEAFSEVKSKITQILQRDCSCTQTELQEELAGLNIIRTQSAISKLLKNMNYTKKRLVRVPEERNTPRTIDARQEYCNKIFHIRYEKLVFLDETDLICTIVGTMVLSKKCKSN